MVFWKQFLKISKKPVSQEIRELRRTQLQKKFQSIQELIASNNNVLEMMADMEEKLSGEFLFDRHYINQKISGIAEGVKVIVDRLNDISNNKYAVLHERFLEIILKIETFLTSRSEIPVSSYTIPLDEITKGMIEKLGSKNANLGEVRNRLGASTPDGFAISAFAFKRFMEHNKIIENITTTLSELQIDKLDALNSKSHELQEQIIKAEIPADLEKEILDANSRLGN